ncbi:His-Xaa-Ser system protein HxsD [Bacteroides faecium]|uniref:His-Xaa-Ser system protein HxsD n=1 Tax=Bacteroides faecium TaxID=2715212 RepID=A0A6H0KUW8_9BACE|nr:His-Xaa-Ser system protein HxsD [Bacteroides faecium]QIU97122.1 His-Xaa-Ser system protein HxsD [Bacteroides faecium]
MKLSVDRNIYSDSCISKTIYWLSKDYTFQRNLITDTEEIIVDAKSCLPFDESAFRSSFFDKLNDFKLRCIIEEETKDIRTILYAKAFAEYDELTEDDLNE